MEHTHTHTHTQEEDMLKTLDPLEQEGKKFRLKGQKYLLTYKTHIDKEGYDYFIGRKLKAPPKKLYIAHENGTDDPITPYEHTHVVVDFGKSVDWSSARCLDYENIHPHISKIVNKVQWNKACKYITKEDTSVVLDPEDAPKGGEIDRIWNHDDVREALRDIDDLRMATNIIAVHALKERVWGREIRCAINEVNDMYAWQREVWEYTHGRPNDRQVLWIYDPNGCSGKTQLMKYMFIHEPEKYEWIQPSGRLVDMSYTIYETIGKGWRGDTFIINLARSATCEREFNHVYVLIENLKDGVLTSSKYKSGKMLLPSMHVVVLSNVLPDTDKLTYDRWDIVEVIDRDTIVEVPVKRPSKGHKLKPDGF